MDYIEAFKNLKTNQKYSRKSPHKAVLLLAIMEMYENNVLTDNELLYDETLKSTFLKVWNKVLPGEAKFLPEAYLPFWHMQSDDFWHIVPIRGKEDILTLMRDNHIKPSESKLRDCVRYAELDEDLYFMMTMPSSRTSLRRVLLETYTTLSPKMIEKIAKSTDNVIDNSIVAMNEYEEILNGSDKKNAKVNMTVENESQNLFAELSEDIQITLNFEYFAFLKNHRQERELFKELFPSVYDLYKSIAVTPIKQGEISPSLSFVYDNFLCDLKITLMSEDGSMELIDQINAALDKLRGASSYKSIAIKEEPALSYHAITVHKIEEQPIPVGHREPLKPAQKSRKGKPWTSNEEKMVSIYYQQGYSIEEISLALGRTEIPVKKRLASLGLIEFVLDMNNEPAADNDVKLEDIVESSCMQDNKIRVDGKWYDYKGCHPREAESNSGYNNEIESHNTSIEDFDYETKGKLKNIDDYIQNSYDYLWLIAIVNFMGEKHQSSTLSYDNIACMMIANAWELLNEHPEIREKEPILTECIEFLIEESKEYMDSELYWSSDKVLIYEMIKDYPIAGTFEETVETIIEMAPLNVLAPWIAIDDQLLAIADSQSFKNSCLYALHPRRIDPYIEINPKWSRYLFFKHNNLIDYFKKHYVIYMTK